MRAASIDSSKFPSANIVSVKRFAQGERTNVQREVPRITLLVAVTLYKASCATTGSFCFVA